MKLNLSPAVVAAVHELQEDSALLAETLEDIENYIIDNVDSTGGDEKQAVCAISHVKFLRSIRKLLLQINQNEQD